MKKPLQNYLRKMRIAYFFPQTFILNWRKIASLRCFGLCRTSAWVSLRYTCVSSLFSLPLTSHLILPSSLSQSTGLSSLGPAENSHWLPILHMVMCMFQCYSLHLSQKNLTMLCLHHHSPSNCLHRASFWRKKGMLPQTRWALKHIQC